MNRVRTVFFWIFLVSIGLFGWILFRNRTWTEPEQRAVLLIHPEVDEVQTPLSLVLWRPDSQELLMIAVPEDLRFRASHNGEAYNLSGLPRLAEIESWSEQAMLREVSLQFGVVFDGSMTVDFPASQLSVEYVRREALMAFLGRQETKLGLWDRWTWWRLTLGADALRSQVIPFESAWKLPNGQLNTSTYDRFARLRLQDTTIRQSQWSIRVMNASGIAGDAARHARMLELIGYGVRSTDSQGDRVPSALRLQPALADDIPENMWASKRLQHLFSDWESRVDETLLETQRVQAEVLVGNLLL